MGASVGAAAGCVGEFGSGDGCCGFGLAATESARKERRTEKRSLMQNLKALSITII